MPDKILLDAGPTEKGWHYYETLLRCLRLAGAARCGLLKNRRKGPALLRGSLGHVGLAHKYAQKYARAHGENPEAVYDPEAAVRILAGKNAAKDQRWEDLVPLVLEALDAYHAHYGDRDEGWEVLRVEHKLEAQFSRGSTVVPYRQRADLLVRGPDRKIRIPDHKFVGYIDKRKINRYALSGQMLGYTVFGYLFWGARFGGPVLNLIEVGDGKRDFRFRRVAVPQAPAAVADLADSVLDAAEEVERMIALGRPWWKWTARFNEAICWNYDECPLFDWCRFGVPQDVQDATGDLGRFPC